MHHIDKIIIYYDKDEVLLIIDSERILFSLKNYSDFNIKEKDIIDNDIYEKICIRSEYHNCLKKAFRAISYSNISKKQLYRKLKSEFSENIIVKVLDRLTEMHYINDAENAKRYAEIYQKRLYGKQRIITELMKRGFEREDIRIAVDELEVNQEEYNENIVLLIKKKFKEQKIDRENKQKVYLYLRNKGYSSSDISSAINRIVDEDDIQN
ncbi:MAG: hypothetical protein A2Y17_03055 [Clostridiales bacterium GWF2_38_85]|nr:MAG: hypothetical protein A2Y17_03055 [Clostridiales bacterium GWF2_38_85]